MRIPDEGGILYCVRHVIRRRRGPCRFSRALSVGFTLNEYMVSAVITTTCGKYVRASCVGKILLDQMVDSDIRLVLQA